LRNIFDQYSQPENRVTHALMTALDQDRKLLGLFLRELVSVKAPTHPQTLSVLEQQYPGEPEPSEEELERRGIPDGWIYDEEGWCVFVETKVLTTLYASQIERHRRTAERRGFKNITAVAIVPRRYISLPEDVVVLEWRMIYGWLRKHAPVSAWAARAANYLEIAEKKLIDTQQFVEGTLTMFAGFPFGPDHPYTYLEGKRVLSLALNELRARNDLKKQLGMNPKVSGRPAITGREADAVWDFLSLSSATDAAEFTKYPHLTLGVTAHAVEAMVTVPHRVNARMRRNIRDLGEAGFQALTTKVVGNMKPLLRKVGGATPWFKGVQRRYPSQKSRPYIDARIDFDLRTAVPSGGALKIQPRWLSAAYGSFVSKQGTNYQIQMGVIFGNDKCPELREGDAIDLVVHAWLACKPLMDLAR
jgi:hypothetical protein